MGQMNQKAQRKQDAKVASQYVRCLKCGDALPCSRYDTEILLNHIRCNHPELRIVDANAPKKNKKFNKAIASDTGTSNDHLNFSQCSSRTGKAASDCAEIPICDVSTDNAEAKCKEASVLFKRGDKKTSKSNLTKSARFRNSIEHWRPLEGCIYCPNCNKTSKPCIKTRREMMSGSICGSCCILACWPLCFLPFFFPNDNKYIYCGKCSTFLGLYDCSTFCVRPNKELLESNDDDCQCSNSVAKAD